MSKLKAIKPKQAKPAKAKILVFAKAGAGKTYTSLDFPNVYYIDTEGGASLSHYTDKLEKSGGMYLGIEQGANDFNTILEQVDALMTEQHPFKTLVIDSTSKVFNDDVAAEAERLGDKNVFGADKKRAIGFMKRLVSRLSKLDMNVILIAHEKSLWFKGEQVGVTFDCWDKLDYELDLCLNVIKQGNSRKARVTKSRLEGFKDGELIDWSYETFAERYGRDVLEADAKPVELASPKQLQEIQGLLQNVKLEEGQEAKWFKKANCESWQEMESDKIQACIDYIKTKLTNQQ